MATATRRALVHEGYHLARGTCAGVLFAIPALYTMELWWLAYDMPVAKLLGLVALFGLAEGHHPAIALRMVALLATPIAVGYAVAAALLGREDEEPARPAPGGPYWRLRDLLVVAAGCLFVGLSIAPIEETLLTGPMLSPGHALAIAAASWGYAALISYVAGVQGKRASARSPEADHAPPWAAACNIYAACLLTSAAMLYFLGYAFGDQGWGEVVMMTVALAFPGTVGGSAGRLILEGG